MIQNSRLSLELWINGLKHLVIYYFVDSNSICLWKGHVQNSIMIYVYTVQDSYLRCHKENTLSRVQLD